jgi:anti-sigma regulatory factor (Ser/Thr protein kinase)
MQELSMNVLDVAQNSVAAGAKLIEISLEIDTPERRLLIVIADDGCGIDSEMLKTVTDPFTTSRKTRRVGLGLPFLKEAAESTGGALSITSSPGVGTKVEALFTLGHIDLMPIGDIAGTITTLVQFTPGTDFIFTARADESSFTVDTRELRELLGPDVGFDVPEVARWLNEYLQENTAEFLKRSIII